MRTEKINRRKFLGSAAVTAATFTIVPSHVLAGSGKVAPSDKVIVAQIGCGTEGLREMPDILLNERTQLVAVCDVNKYSNGYLDWSADGLLNDIRATLGDPQWGSHLKGIPGGLDVGKDFVEKYYAKNKPSGKYKGCNAYEDFRELLAKEKDIDAVKIMTPDHLHATIALAAMKEKLHVITHKPIANRMTEARLVMDKVRETGLKTHLLAWNERPEYELMLKWVKDGVIGNLKEVHNWSFRPVWPKWTTVPTDTPPIPDGFNWNLWLGPSQDRPYHPNLTHNVFRGWYEFGGGSMADMGHYSLFPFFQIFGIKTPPISAKAYGNTTSTSTNNVCHRVNNVDAYPAACMFRLQFPKQETLPAFDLYWYDGGMKPFEPEELLEDGREIAPEGIMLVGDKGKILGGFRGENPEIIPLKKKEAYQEQRELGEVVRERRSDTWSRAILEGKESPGSFLEAECITETINLATVALRTGKKVDYDSKNLKITNVEEANKFLTREYRPGWELK
ncbi:Gfo/Idh/MocA family oxidoreductase [Flammeovirgaceae bacterium SG7u.111]|nr:Gfo/Idh/MocA family oxidoreductase [Flammeovirgaceae bacterium SG7u.132]WPO37038.1 Gfo/Idh/MocA family oxidoreductase [Flammeovirgaceae bacterium SG7u.111]